LRGLLGLAHFVGGGAVAVRESNHWTDEHAGTGQHLARERDGIRLHTGRGHVVFARDFATSANVVIRHRGMQQRVIDHLGQVTKCDCHAQKETRQGRDKQSKSTRCTKGLGGSFKAMKAGLNREFAQAELRSDATRRKAGARSERL
jgi:hypothetical protein